MNDLDFKNSQNLTRIADALEALLVEQRRKNEMLRECNDLQLRSVENYDKQIQAIHGLADGMHEAGSELKKAREEFEEEEARNAENASSNHP